MTRDERQYEGVDKFVKAGGTGTLEYPTGFGKTKTALKVVARMRATVPSRIVTVVVPSQNLKDQWLDVFTEEKIINCNVIIINSASKAAPFVTDLLILDEIHRYAAEGFSKVNDVVTRRFTLGLTATFKRLDGKHRDIEKYCPIIDRISTHEARTNGWIANCIEFNLGLALSPFETEKYKLHEEKYEKALNFFNGDFGLMQSCTGIKPIRNITGVITEPRAVKYARELGWNGFPVDVAEHRRISKVKHYWGDEFHKFNPNVVNITAVNGLRSIQALKSIINKSETKIVTAVDIIKTFDEMQSVVFGEVTSTSDKIASLLGPSAMTYHSNMVKPASIPGTIKMWKESILDAFNKNVYRVLCTAKGVDEGADFPGAQLGLRISGTSSPTQYKQRRGRMTRKHGEKVSIFISLYFKDTKETPWLRKSQSHADDVIWVESVKELIEILTI